MNYLLNIKLYHNKYYPSPKKIIVFTILLLLVQGINQLYNHSAYAATPRKPKVITISATEDDLQGWVKVPFSSLYGSSFIKWEETIVGGDVQYYGGELFIFYSHIDRNQLDKPGYGDKVNLELVFDTENLMVSGTLSGKAITKTTYDSITQNGEKLDSEPGVFSTGTKNGTCEATFTATIKGILIHQYGDTYKVKGNVTITVWCMSTLYAIPGPKYEGKEFIIKETKTYKKTVEIYGNIAYFSNDNIQSGLNIGTTTPLNDPDIFSFMVMGDWGSPCKVARVTEWYEETQIKLEGPKTITPQIDKVVFIPVADAALGALNKVEWQFSYKSKAGEWVDLKKVVGSSLKPFNVTDTGGEVSLNSWHDLAVANGVTGIDSHTMQMRIGVQAFLGDQLVGVSNTLVFEYGISTEMTLELDGPENINSSPIFAEEDYPQLFLIEAMGEGSSLYRWVDCTFSYKAASGSWVEIDKTSSNRTVVEEYGIIIPMSGEGVNWGDWLTVAEEQGVKNGDERVLKMRVIANALTEDEISLATSNEYFFDVKNYQRFNLTIRESLDLYPKTENKTNVSVDFGGTKLTEPISFGFELPTYIRVAMFPVETDPNEISIKKNLFSFSFNSSRLPPNSKLPIEAKIKVTATSGKYNDSKDVMVRCLPYDWLFLYYVAADTVPDLQPSEENNIASVIDATQAIKTPRILTYILADFRSHTKNIQDEGQPLKGNAAYFFKANMGFTEIIQKMGPTKMSNEQVLTAFIKNSQAMAPSRNTWLSVTDHGAGIKGLIWDYNQGSYLNVTVFESALQASGVKLDVLSLDACYMAMAEIVIDLKDQADFITCSEISEPSEGLAYEQILKSLLQNPRLTPEELAKLVVQTFNRWTNKSSTQSAVDMAKVPQLETALNMFGEAGLQAYTEKDEKTMTAIEEAADTARYAESKPYVDIKDFMQKLLANTKLNSLVKEAAQQVVAAVDATVIENDSKLFEINDKLLDVQVNPSGLNGLTIFLWNNGLEDEQTAQYKSFRNIRATILSDKWLEFVDEFKKYSDTMVALFTLTHPEKELHLIVTDNYGRRVGFNETHFTRDRILTEIPDCLYIDYMEGVKSIVLPKSEVTYRVTVDGSDMEEAIESYTIKATVVENGAVSSKTTQATIKQGEIQYTPVTISGKTLEIGKTIVKGEVVTPTAAQPTNGIPAYSEVSILLGVLIVVILQNIHQHALK